MTKRSEDQKPNRQTDGDGPDSSTDFDDEGGDDMKDRVFLRSGEEIARYIGYSPRRIKTLVRTEGLPARKIGNKWRANICDLRPWVIRHIRGE